MAAKNNNELLANLGNFNQSRPLLPCHQVGPLLYRQALPPLAPPLHIMVQGRHVTRLQHASLSDLSYCNYEAAVERALDWYNKDNLDTLHHLDGL